MCACIFMCTWNVHVELWFHLLGQFDGIMCFAFICYKMIKRDFNGKGSFYLLHCTLATHLYSLFLYLPNQNRFHSDVVNLAAMFCFIPKPSRSPWAQSSFQGDVTMLSPLYHIYPHPRRKIIFLSARNRRSERYRVLIIVVVIIRMTITSIINVFQVPALCQAQC